MTGWPDPWAPLNKAMAAALIGVSKDTIERVAGAIERGEAIPKVRNPQALTIGKLFADEGEGSTILAERIYRALKIDPHTLSGPFMPPPSPRPAAENPRKRNVVPNDATLGRMSDNELRGQLSEVVTRARASDGGRVPWHLIKAIADALAARGQPPGGLLHGQPLARIDLKKCETWGFVGGFAAQAELGDLWPFVLPLRGGRPADLLAASIDDIKYGQLVALTLEEWLMMLSQVLATEKAMAATELDANLLSIGVKVTVKVVDSSSGDSL